MDHNTGLIAAAEAYMLAVKRLGEESGYNRLTYFEAPILKMPTEEMREEAHERWLELNISGQQLSAAVNASKLTLNEPQRVQVRASERDELLLDVHNAHIELDRAGAPREVGDFELPLDARIKELLKSSPMTRQAPKAAPNSICGFCARRVFEPCQSIAQAQNACTLMRPPETTSCRFPDCDCADDKRCHVASQLSRPEQS